ncbi:Eukaryotic translation initiation factor 5 [Camelus dromedarius]|uniref:Eukaryotic translation initiation factor 5 n=1 Tax=Camelus dromedarius TaxID=9838 RepID=A0A5N4C0S1_CAMDR|nr:Eukaryotic translation initiation factor 5 [Camelus dromedarius]
MLDGDHKRCIFILKEPPKKKEIGTWEKKKEIRRDKDKGKWPFIQHGHAKVLAPHDDLEGAIEFFKKKKEGIIVEADVKVTGPLVLTDGHFNQTIREQIKKFPTVLTLLTEELSSTLFTVCSVR